MSFVSSLLDASKGAGFQAGGTNIAQASTVDQANQQYAHANSGLAQQQNFVNALQGQNGIANQSSVYSQLQGLANGTGPSLAQTQLQNATGQNVANQAALMAGQRGSSSNAGLLARQAGMQGANVQQQAAGQAASLRANEQLGAIGQMGSLATNQVNQQQAGLNAYSQSAQNEQQNVLNGLAQQNNANVSMQSNQNSANASIAAVNAQTQGKMLGGVMSGAGAALMSHGGMVQPQHLASGGAVQNAGGSFMGGWSKAMGFNNDNKGGPNQLQPAASQNGMAAQDPISQGSFDLGKGIASRLGSGVSSLFTQAPQAMPMAGGAMDAGAVPTDLMFAANGGDVPGKAKVKGDSPKNDTVPTMLSPGEIVIPRSIAQHPNAPELAAHFVRQSLMKGQHNKAQMFDGGQQGAVPASLSPDTEAQPGDMLGSMLAQGTQLSPEDTFQNRVGQEMKLPSVTFNPFGGNQAVLDKDSAERRVLQQMASDRNTKDNSKDDAAAKAAEMDEMRVKAGLQPLSKPATGSASVASQPMQTAQGFGGQMSADMYGNDAMMAAYGKGIGETKQGIAMQQKADQLQASRDLEAAKRHESQMLHINQNYEQEYGKLKEDYSRFQQRIIEDKVNPDRYLQNMGGGQKTRTAIGLILGGIGGGILGQENPALKFLNAQIDRDVAGQRANMESDHNLLKANMQQFGNLHDATMATKAMQTEVYSAQLKKAAAEAGTPAAAARALQAAGQLDMQSAPMLQQLAMRKAVLGGMGSGHVDPSIAIRMLVPKEQQEHAFKELESAQQISKVRDNALSAFDKIAQINTVGGRVTSPLQTPKQVAALRDPIVAGISKETAGRFTEQDAHMLETLFPAVGDSQSTLRIKRSKMNALLSEKDNHAILSGYGIHTNGLGRFGSQGQSRFQESAPVFKKAN